MCFWEAGVPREFDTHTSNPASAKTVAKYDLIIIESDFE